MATIERRGTSQFRAIVRRSGQPTQRKTFPTRLEAERWARAIETRVDAGAWLPTPEQQATTLHEALGRYAREVTPGKRGARQEARRIAAWQRHALAQRPLASLRGMDFAAYRDERLAKVGPDSVRLELAVISNLFKIARCEWGMEGLGNPMAAVRKPSPPPGRDRRLAAGEEEALGVGAGPVLSQAITLALETAMRRGELAGLRRDQVNLERRVARLPLTKNGSAREVPLSTRAVAALKALPARLDGYVLGPPEATAEWLTHAFGDLCDAIGIQGLRFHDLRHEATSRLFERGLTVMEVAAITGHKDLKMLRRYTHLRAEDLARKLG